MLLSLLLAVASLPGTAILPQTTEEPGATLRIYEIAEEMGELMELVPGQTPNVDVRIPKLELKDKDFFGYEERFLAEITATLIVATEGETQFRLACDDGAAVFIDGKSVVEDDGTHPPRPVLGSTRLSKGRHELKIRYFEASGGQEFKLEWKPSGASDFSVLDALVLRVPAGLTRVTSPGPKRLLRPGGALRPGNGVPLAGLHPGWDLVNIRPLDFEPQVGGMAFRPDGKLLVSSFPPNQSGQFKPDLMDGQIWLLDGVTGNDRRNVTRRLAATDLQEPLGMAVVNGKAYVATRTQIIELIDANRDDFYEEKKVVGSGWRTDNYHHFTFGLAEKDGWLYAALSTSITFDAPGINGPNPRYRGSMFRVNPAAYNSALPLANIEFLDSGHRTPNGVSNGPNGLILVGENQGAWQPSNKLNVLEVGGFYGHFNNATFKNSEYPLGGAPGQFDDKPFTPPAMYLPQGDIANSPGQTVVVPNGEFKGQMLISDVKYGGLRRGWLEKVNGVWQGGAVQYSQGFEVGTNRLVWGPDGALYIGGIGATESWAWTNPKTGKWTTFGLQKIRPNGKSAFEVASVNVTEQGFRVQFNRPVQKGQLRDLKRFRVRQWRYVPTFEYGGPKVDREDLTVTRATASSDGKSVDLTIAGRKEGRVVYFNLDLTDEAKTPLWATEVWYTLNKLPVSSWPHTSALAHPNPRLLVFSKTTGFRHDSIPAGQKAIREIAAEHGFTATFSEDASLFTPAKLASFDAVVFLNTTGDILDAGQKAAFQGFIRAGGGFVGIHSASDTEHNWPWFKELAGGEFAHHPEIQSADLRIEDAAHPSTSFLPTVWPRVDEWYDFVSNPREKVRVLANLDPSSYSGGRMADHPAIWCREFDGGRSWYTALGHTDGTYDELLFRRHLSEGILWAANSNAKSKPANAVSDWQFGKTWTASDVELVNSKGTEPLLSKREFGDARVHVEFNVPKGGNSGVYLMGRYEIQILDSFGKPNKDIQSSDCGGVYERWKNDAGYEGVPPRINASRPAGEWQSLDIVFRAPKFKGTRKTQDAEFIEVRLNGVVVQSRVRVTGPTRASMFEDERPTGPLMLQGDHGPIRYRNLWIAPLESKK